LALDAQLHVRARVVEEKFGKSKISPQSNGKIENAQGKKIPPGITVIWIVRLSLNVSDEKIKNQTK
jgi:hypothetical protein